MAEMMVLEAVAQEAAPMELALEAGSVHLEVVDMAAEPEDTAGDYSVDGADRCHRWVDRRHLVYLAE